MKVDQVILEQLDAALNGSGFSGSGKGNGEFAVVLDQALTGGSKEKSTSSGMQKEGEFAAASGSEQALPEAEQKMLENKKSGNDEVVLEEKLELLIFSLLKSDRAALEEFTADKKFQGGKPAVEKIIAALKADNISTGALKEELGDKFEQQAKQEDGLKTKEKVLNNKPEKAANGVNNEAKSEIDLKAKIATAEKEALLKEKAFKAKNTGKANEAAEKTGKESASPKGKPGEAVEKQVDKKGMATELDVKKAESAGKKSEHPVKVRAEETKSAKASAKQSSDNNAEQKTAAKVENSRQNNAMNQGRNESSRAETNTQRIQNVNPAHEQSTFQQLTVKGDEALQGSRVPNAQNANLRESVMQQLQGRMIYLRESGNNPAEMRVTLHPPELGEITVRVFSSKGRLSASIIAETPLAREILESSVTELRQRMNFVNIQFDQLDVSTAGKEYEGFGRPDERDGSGKAEFGEADGEDKGSVENESPLQQIPPDDSGSGIDFWA